MTTAPFKRVLRPGKFTNYDDRRHNVFVRVEWTGERLSFMGVEGPKANGDCHGGCGQIKLDLTELAPGWTTEMVARLIEVWDRWHLNDMRAGSPAQMRWLREHADEFGRQHDYYMWASTKLADAGLSPDPEHDGYVYGHQWLSEDVPDEILAELLAFPETDKEPAWV